MDDDIYHIITSSENEFCSFPCTFWFNEWQKEILKVSDLTVVGVKEE